MATEYFPPDILFQIFLNLPTKTLRRFLSVSQLWYSIISSSLFVSSHLTKTPHSQNNSFFFIKHRNLFTEEKHEEFSFYLLDQTQYQETQNQETQNQETHNQETQNQETQNQEIENQENQEKEITDTLGVPSEILYPPIVGSAGFNRIIGVDNGVILQIDDFNNDKLNPYLWNPAVNVFVTLPTPEIANFKTYEFGFWFDSRDCDFKVMVIAYRSNEEEEARCELPPVAEVYSLNTGEWGRVNVEGVECYMPGRSWSCFNLNGRLHWIGYKYDPFLSLILSYDTNDGVFREIQLPYELLTMIAYDLKITETMGCLAVIGDDRTMGVCRIWVMKEYGDLSSWTNLCDITLCPHYYKFLGFWKNDDVLLIRNSRQLVRYVPGSKSFVDLDIVLGGLSSFWMYAGKYEESLALLDMGFSDEWIEDESETTSLLKELSV